MEFGVFIPRTLRSTSEGVAFAARLAEELGYDYIAVTEHIVVPVRYELSPYPYTENGLPYWTHEEPWLEAMVTLGFVAGVTKRIRMLTSVIPNNTRDPLSLAKQAATVDVLSGGRLELGIGTGWSLDQAAALGHPTDFPYGRLSETIEILRKAWGEDSFEHHGRFYDYPELGVHPHPVQGRDLPIWIGGTSPRMVRMAAEQGDGLILPPLRADLGPQIRAQLPERVRMHASAHYDGDFDAYRRQLDELVAGGFDRFGGPRVSVDSDPQTWETELRRFADEVLSRLDR
jgi:probable F420-dependent oxidoreductase